MKQLVICKIKEVSKELIDYLDGNKSEMEKAFIVGELYVLIQLLLEIKEDK